MTKSKNTKRALLFSVLSMMLCMAMLVGSTFAWFTDSVTSGKNKIVAGNLDVELEYEDADGNWQTVGEDTELFSEFEADKTTENLWEPGHTEVVYLKVRNAGTLALKYQFTINVANETVFTNALGDENCKLSDYLVFGQVASDTELEKYETREAAWTAVGDTKGLSDYTKEAELYPAGTDGKPSEQYVALVVYMPTTVGNEANYRGDVVPSIDLGVNLVATQTPYESDSFNDQYDKEAWTELIMQAQTDGTYSDGKDTYVKMNNEYIPVTKVTSGLFKDEAGNDYVSMSTGLKRAFADATNGEHIIFIKDFSITNNGNRPGGTPETYIVADNVVLDLNGKTLTVNNNDKFMLAGANNTIKNGTIKAGPMSGSATGKISYSLGITASSKNALIEDMVVEGGIEALGQSTVVLRNVTSTATNFYNIYLAGGATATVESGTFNSHNGMVHFYTQTSGDKVIVKGGTFDGGSPRHGGNGKMENLIG